MIEHDDFQLKAAAKERVRERAYWTSILSGVDLMAAFLIRFHKPSLLQ
nr:hypothetical protein [Bacillus pumilus]